MSHRQMLGHVDSQGSRQGQLGQTAVSEQIRSEIQRFESVHPCIYAIYDLIELIDEPIIAQQLRDHVVCIEGNAC